MTCSQTSFTFLILLVLCSTDTVVSSPDPGSEVLGSIEFQAFKCRDGVCSKDLVIGERTYTVIFGHLADISKPDRLIRENEAIVPKKYQNRSRCVHYGKVFNNGAAIGSIEMDLCKHKMASLYTLLGDFDIVPIEQTTGSKLLRRRRSTDTHVVYSLKGRSRRKRNATPLDIQDVSTPIRNTEKELPSFERLSPKRKLNFEIAAFVDKEYQTMFHKSPFNGSREDLRQHIIRLMQQVQMWYYHPSLGYKIQIYLTKIFFLQKNVSEIGVYTGITGFCKDYQVTFLPGGSRADGNTVTWDSAIYFSGVLGMFGKRSDNTYIYGRAHRWGTCNPQYQCSGVNDHFEIDKNLTRVEDYLGRLVTHELSHTLGMADEYLAYSNRCPAGIMFDQHSGRWWSKCSVHELKRFLLSEFSNCLNTTPDKKNKDIIKIKSARSNYSTENAVAGGWGTWSDYGPCSRSCDGGVQKAPRTCDNPVPKNNGRICVGFSYMMRMCNETACPDDIRKKTLWDRYAEECTKVGAKPEFRRDLPGLFKQGTPRCGNMCRKDSIWRAYTVTDGFKCREGQDDVCVEGICMTVGCDGNRFYSKKRRDVCGVCGGKGKTCRVVSGVFYGQKEGYEIAKIIPKGSRGIFIKTNATNGMEMRDNFIDLGPEDINNPRASIPTQYMWLYEGDEGTYKFKWAGVYWEYMNDRNLPHYLKAMGRVDEDVFVWLRRDKGAAPNLGIEWRYIVDEKTEVTPIVPTLPGPTADRVIGAACPMFSNLSFLTVSVILSLLWV